MKRKTVLNRILILFIALSMMMVSQNSFVMAEDFKVSQEKYSVDDSDGDMEEIEMQEDKKNGQGEELLDIEEVLEQNENFKFYELPDEDSNGNAVDEEYLNKYCKKMEEEFEKKLNDNNNLEVNSLRIPTYEISYSDKYPIVLNENVWNLFIYNTFRSNKGLYASVIGKNGIIISELGKCCAKHFHCWFWKPKVSGIYKFVIRDSNRNNEIVYKKKIYINSFNERYLQLDDIKVQGNNEIGAKLVEKGRNHYSCNDINGYDLNKTEMKFVVSEPHIWCKTLKQNISQYKFDNEGYYTADASQLKSNVSQKEDKFQFNKGNYQVGAFIKKDNSIEWEDAKFENYCNESNISKLELTCTQTRNTEKRRTYHVEAKGTEEHKENIPSKLVYAFLIYDENGTKKWTTYSQENQCHITFSAPGTYYVLARVKHDDYKFNSYEAQNSYKIVIEDENRSNASIKKVEMKKYICCAFKKTIELDENKTKTIESHESYIIDISSNSSDLEYKAYAVHDGYCYALCEYSQCNEIPFYPKSYGEYKIIVLAKHSSSGLDSEDARKEYTINVE